MNDKLRSVNTKFWNDSFVEDLSPSEKLLFLYLLTNPLTNLLGIYEVTIKRISYDTGLTKETISKGFERFGKDKKAFLTSENFVILPNWLKNQRLNSNMKVAVAREFSQLPKYLKDSILKNDLKRLGNDSEGFGIIMECLDKYEIEIEDEIEDESEGEINIDFEVFWNLYDKKVGAKEKCKKKWDLLKDEDRQNVIDTLPGFLKTITDKQYQPFPETYLNQKRWNDEISRPKKINDYEFTEADFNKA